MITISESPSIRPASWRNECIFGSLLPSAGYEQNWPRARLQHCNLAGWMLIEGSDNPLPPPNLILNYCTHMVSWFQSCHYGQFGAKPPGCVAVITEQLSVSSFVSPSLNLLIKSWFTAGGLLSGLFSQSMALIIQLKLWGDVGNLPTPQFWK